MQYFKNLHKKKMQFRPLLGNNFILNPEIIVDNPLKLTDRQLAEYLGICAYRNYAHYLQQKEANLPMEYLPSYIPRSVVEDNPLLAIKQSKIIFIYEEIK